MLSGCELKDRGDNELNGKALFVERCGACDALDRAGTAGTVGPDLDAAFRWARRDGLGRETIAGVVEEQILHPRKRSPMPAGLVTGEDEGRLADEPAIRAAIVTPDATITEGFNSGVMPGDTASGCPTRTSTRSWSTWRTSPGSPAGVWGSLRPADGGAPLWRRLVRAPRLALMSPDPQLPA